MSIINKMELNIHDDERINIRRRINEMIQMISESVRRREDNSFFQLSQLKEARSCQYIRFPLRLLK